MAVSSKKFPQGLSERAVRFPNRPLQKTLEGTNKVEGLALDSNSALGLPNSTSQAFGFFRPDTVELTALRTPVPRGRLRKSVWSFRITHERNLLAAQTV